MTVKKCLQNFIIMESKSVGILVVRLGFPDILLNSLELHIDLIVYYK